MIGKSYNAQQIRKSMEKELDPKRYDHTIGVAYTATSLAMRYDAALIKDAEVAGLLHDAAKCISNNKKIAMCKKYNIAVNDIEKKNPFLLHAKLGSFLAMKKYNIYEDDVIKAILNHTTGRPGMSLLEKIIYVADYIEPNRKQAPNLTQIRALAFQDIDRTLLMILKDTLSYLNAVGGDIDPITRKTYEYYQERIQLDEIQELNPEGKE